MHIEINRLFQIDFKSHITIKWVLINLCFHSKHDDNLDKNLDYIELMTAMQTMIDKQMRALCGEDIADYVDMSIIYQRINSKLLIIKKICLLVNVEISIL